MYTEPAAIWKGRGEVNSKKKETIKGRKTNSQYREEMKMEK
jgi:hypothetical protein